MMSIKEYEKNKNIISDLIKFHLKWNKQPEIENNIIYFTLREISLFIEALIDNENKLLPYQIVLIIYGSKYPEKELYKLKNILNNYNSFKNYERNNFYNINIEFENCFVSFVGFVTKQQLNDSTTNN